MKSIINIVNSRLQNDRLIDKDGLGDRSKYIGASEVAGCPKKAYLEKTQPEKVKHSNKQLLIFERGHLAEDILKKSFKGLNYTSQKEVKTLNGEIKAHLDFILHNDDGSDTVVECKTTTLVGLDEPRESWIAQIQVQMGLLKQETKNDNINGIIYAVDLNNGLTKEWNVKYDKKLTGKIIKKAKKLYTDIQEKREPRGEINPLCAFCSFKNECSTLKNGVQTIPAEFSKYIKVINSFKIFEKKVKEMKSEIKDFMKSVGITKGYDEDEKYIVAFTSFDKKSVDNKTLHEDNPSLKELYTVVKKVETLRIV